MKFLNQLKSVVQLWIKAPEAYTSTYIQDSVVTDILALQLLVYAGPFRIKGEGVSESCVIVTLPDHTFPAMSVAETSIWLTALIFSPTTQLKDQAQSETILILLCHDMILILVLASVVQLIDIESEFTI